MQQDIYYRLRNPRLLLQSALDAFVRGDNNEAAHIYIYLLGFWKNRQGRLLCYRNLWTLMQYGAVVKFVRSPSEHSFPWRIPDPTLRFPLTMTTCKRFDLFQRTITSFLEHADTWCVSQWYIVDDGSSEADLRKMEILLESLDLNYQLVEKDNADKGHAKSMNQIRQWVLSQGSPFFIHLEDDFEFFVSAPMIRHCAEILLQYPQYAQCLFSNSYKEERHDFASPPWGTPHMSESGVPFYEHMWKDPSNPHGYWPGFSLRPGLTRVDALRQVGEMIEIGVFEKDYSMRIAGAQWKTAYLETVYCEHIGRKTREMRDPSKTNAYALNQCPQFGELQRAECEYQQIRTVIAEQPLDRALERLFLAPFDSLDAERVRNMVAHVQCWYDLTDMFKERQILTIHLPDKPRVETAHLAPLLNGFELWDMVLVRHDATSGQWERIHQEMGSAYSEADAYVLHYSGAQKLLDFVRNNGTPLCLAELLNRLPSSFICMRAL